MVKNKTQEKKEKKRKWVKPEPGEAREMRNQGERNKHE